MINGRDFSENKISRRMLPIIFLLLLGLLIAEILTGFNYRGEYSDRMAYQVILICLISTLTFHFVYYGKAKKSTPIWALIGLSACQFADLIVNNLSFDGEALIAAAYSWAWVVFFFYASRVGNQLNGHLGTPIYLGFSVAAAGVLMGFSEFRDRYNVLLAPGIYTALVFFPWIQAQKKSPARTFANIVLYLLVAVSFKRGAVIALAAAIVVNWIIAFRQSGDLRSPGWSLATLGIFISSMYLVDYYFEGALSSRFAWDSIIEGSGRESSNSVVIEALKNHLDLGSLLVGFEGGEDFLQGFIGHNDWATIFLRYGLLGIALFLLFIFSLSNRLMSLYRRRDPLTLPYATALTITLLMSVYSTSYGPTIHPVFLMLFFGFTEGAKKIERVSNK